VPTPTSSTSSRRLLAATPQVILVSVKTFLKNAGNTPSFSISNETIVIETFVWNVSNPLRLQDFIFNVTSPPDTPIDLDGTELLDFYIRPVSHRALQSEEWVSSATDGGLLSVGPILDVKCNPWCTSVNLMFAQSVDYNGEVRFNVRMGTSETNANFSIRVLLSFTVMPEIVVYENEEESLIEQFVHMAFIGNTSADVTFQAAPTSEYPIPVLNSLFLPHGRPKLSVGTPYKDLMFALITVTGRNGKTNFTLVASMDGRNTSRIFALDVLSVNSPPSFMLTSQIIHVFRDQYAIRPYISDHLISEILAGPSDEIDQNLTFSLLPAGSKSQADEESPIDFSLSSVSVYKEESGNWTAIVKVFSKTHKSGTSNLTLILNDNGGSDNGGINTSSSVTFSVIVHTVNQAPSFSLAHNISVKESLGLYQQQRFAYNISAEPEFESGWEQKVTFKVFQISGEPEWFYTAPQISQNGTLQFMPSPFHNGQARFEVILEDSGGTSGNGSNVSMSQYFDLTIESFDDSPSFDLSVSAIDINEVVSNETGEFKYVACALNISAGALEVGQNISFIIFPTVIRVGEGSEAELFNGSDVLSGMAELFLSAIHFDFKGWQSVLPCQTIPKR